MIDKWTRKYMKLAKALADDNTACYSRKIGSVLISKDNEPIGFGYNGAVSQVPHNDDPRYLAHLWKNLLTDKQKDYLIEKYKIVELGRFIHRDTVDERTLDKMGCSFVDHFSGCKTCPRRLLDIPSGQEMELCSCSHSERNTIFNAAKRGSSTKDATIYCWCNLPCHECSIAIIQSGIKLVVCLANDGPDYSKSSRGLLTMAKVGILEIKEQDILND